ncbi:Coat F domain protein [Sporotomaculum syntrophicum]|uniref:Coat F domain protein n=1 Tax=Sporotomaculum syntrophicum TaxID=182264 RepID=A0A9D2WMI0_9FIRM|nr:spore coat protein [Sporotomaculum syntrophicum]KAF1083914.1 Coat F domain protein [Sporotomaculum syntrophicum]
MFNQQQSMTGMQGMQGSQYIPGQQGMQNQQQPNMIKNPQSNLTPEVKSSRINDRDTLNLALSQEKFITDNLNVFVREASHRQLHNDVMRIFNETHAMTREFFDLMFRKGWYTLEPEQPQKMAQTYQQFSQYSTQFPYPMYRQ